MFFTEALSLFSQNAGSACRTGQLSINRFQSFWNHVPQCPGGSCQIRAKGAPPADARRTASSHKAPLNGSCPVWTVGGFSPPSAGESFPRPPPMPGRRFASGRHPGAWEILILSILMRLPCARSLTGLTFCSACGLTFISHDFFGDRSVLWTDKQRAGASGSRRGRQVCGSACPMR